MKHIKKIIFITVIVLMIVLIGGFIYIQTSFVSKQEVKNKILSDMNVSKESVYFNEIDFDFSEKLYDVELYYNNQEYEYTLSAKTGEIIYTTFSKQTNQNNEINSDQTDQSSNSNDTSYIGTERAKQIALDHAGISESESRFEKVEKDKENGKHIYEIEFTNGNYEYEYDIDAVTGEILKSKKEPQYR